MSLKMEKKAEHFVRLLAEKLVENERAQQDPEAQGNAGLKKGFRRALDNLPKSPLRTELQKNAATYFRKLEVLTRNSSNVKTSSDEEFTRQKKGKPQSDARKTKDEKKKKEKSKDVTKTPLSQKSSEKVTLKSSKTKRKADLISSSGEHLRNGEEDNGVSMETHPKMETDAEHSQGEGFAFNVYATDPTSDMIDALAKLPARKKMRLAPHAYNSLCQGKSFCDFLEALHPGSKDEPAMDNLTPLKQEILTGFGSSDAKVLTRCEANCLSGIITVAEKALDLKDMARMKEVQGFILNFLLWVKTQHEALAQGQDKHSHPLSNFEDLAAAMLSIYMDLSIILSRHSDDKGVAAGRHTLSKILLFVGHTPVHQLNLLLQVTSPTTEDCQFMVPIYKHMLSRVPSEMTNELLIKYLYAVRFSQEVLKKQEKELLDDIISVAMTAEPSEEFLQWMFSAAPSIYRSLPEPVKNRQVPVVEHLIKRVTSEYMDSLLDIASDAENESQSLSYETSQDDAPPESKEEPVGALFFTDTNRDEDLARQVDSDAESVDALHSHLGTLLDDFDKESSSDGDADSSDVDFHKTRGGAGQSQRNPSRGSTKSQDDDSDLEIIDMDTSAGLDPRLSETTSLEEQRYNSMMATKDKKTLLSQSSRKVPRRDSGSSQNSSARNAEGKSSRGGGDGDVVLVEPELQVDSDKESFTTAKDNLDTTKESIVIDVDEEITFKWKGSRSRGDKNKDQEDEGEEEREDADEEDIEDVEGDGDDEDSRDEADGRNEDGDTFRSEQSSKESSTKPSILSPKKSQGGIKEQEQSPDETAKSNQHMHLRSMDAGTAGQGQSSLLRFFSPVRHVSEGHGNDFKKPLDKVDLEDVEVVPDSCDSGQDEKSDKDTRVTPRRMKSLKTLQGNSINLEKTLPDKAVSQSAKGKRLRSPARERKLGSDQKVKSGNKPISSSSEGEVDPALFLSPVVSLNKADVSQSKMNPSVIEDAVSEGIRRIRAECVTSPSDLKAQPTTRSSASKLSMSKRKALTITGGVKSKKAASDTPRQLFKRAGEAFTPADKATGRSAEKQQGVSPLSPSKVKRVATFGDTYRMLAGISSDSQTDSGSVPAPQSQTPPKRARLRPKDLGEVFAADKLSQNRSGKKQVVDIQPMSESSQASVESGQGSNTSKQTSLAKTPQTLVMQSKRTPVKSSCSTCQEKSASPQEKSTSPQQKSASPKQKSASPQQKSASPKQKLASPQQKSASPQQKSASPQQKSASPKQKSASPQQKSASPQQKSASPQQKSASPKQKSASPKQKSASKLKKSASKLKKAPKTESCAPESRSAGAGATKAAIKRRASLPASKSSKTPTKVCRKSVGSKK